MKKAKLMCLSLMLLGSFPSSPVWARGGHQAVITVVIMAVIMVIMVIIITIEEVMAGMDWDWD